MKFSTWRNPAYLALIASATCLAYGYRQELTRAWVQARAAEVDSRAAEGTRGSNYFPNVLLTTEEGENKLFYDDMIKDKVVLINFIFTTCKSSCPLETARVRKIYNLLKDRVGKDIFFYSISIDPETDTPELLNAYKQRFKLGDGWTFLTGKKDEIFDLQKKLGFYMEEFAKNKNSNHSLDLIIGNQKTGQWLKRSHLENPELLATLLKQLHPEQPVPMFSKSYASAPIHLKEVSDGERLFYSRCADCHSIGHGNDIGPDLLGVTQRRDPKWLKRWIREPDRMIEEKDPVALSMLESFNNVTMPNLKLSQNDVDNLIDFISKESTSFAKGGL